MVNDSTLTTCTLPRSVPTYSHLLWNGKWKQVILQFKTQQTRQKEMEVKSCLNVNRFDEIVETNLSRWNLSEWTISGRFWRMFHKWRLSSEVAETRAPSLTRNCSWSTAGPDPLDDNDPPPPPVAEACDGNTNLMTTIRSVPFSTAQLIDWLISMNTWLLVR